MYRSRSIASLLLILAALLFGGTALAADEHGGEPADTETADEHAGEEAGSGDEHDDGDEHAGEEADTGDEHAGDSAE